MDHANLTTQDWALRYAAAGWRVYPVEPGRKKALFTGWQASATTDPELIRRQWRREPYPNVGLICGEAFAVFDIEAPHLPAFFSYLESRAYVLPETPVSSTGRGGLHLFVKPVADISVTRKLLLGGVHIGEFKTTGGVLAPPSVTEGDYRWLWLPDDLIAAEAPEWLATLISEPAQARIGEARRERPADPAAALDALACAVRDEPAGNRNSMLFWAACRAFEEGIRPDITEAVLCRAARSAGLDDAEARATIESALKRQGVVA
jgi:Bifunctional DNA primase/polymerase, N-terminal